MRLIILSLICLGLTLRAAAQSFTFAYADSLTYAQYMAKDYKALQKSGKEALKQDIDFYYLRMRLGISHYEEKEYSAAQKHFETALEKFPADSVAQEYLYYCYLFTRQDEYINVLAAHMSPSLLQKVGYKRTPLDAIGIEAGVVFTPNARHYENTGILTDTTDFALGKFSGNMSYGKIYVENTFVKRMKAYHSFAYFSTSTLGKFHARNRTEQGYFQNSNLQYNLGLSWQMNHGWKIAAGGSYYYQSLSEYSVIPPDTAGPPGPPVLTILTPVFNNFSGSLSLTKRFGCVTPAVEVSVANFADTLWMQGQLSLTWYPLGTPRFYGVSSATGIHVQNDTTRLVLSQRAGFRVSDHFWAEVCGSWGNHRNYITSLGFLTYNTNDPITWMAGADLKFFVSQLEITPSYRLQQRVGFYDNAVQGLPPMKTYFNFYNHFINFSVIWNF